MPEFTVKEVRLPELHLPEINREDIVRTLSGVRLPDVDLARARRAKLKVPAISLTADDLGRIVAAGAAITRFVRPAAPSVRVPLNPFGRRSRSPVAMITRSRSRRSRRPFVLAVLVVAAVAIFAFMRRPANRRRLEATARDARERFATWRAQDLRPGADVDETPSTAAPSTETLAVADDAPAFEESQTTG